MPNHVEGRSTAWATPTGLTTLTRVEKRNCGARSALLKAQKRRVLACPVLYRNGARDTVRTCDLHLRRAARAGVERPLPIARKHDESELRWRRRNRPCWCRIALKSPVAGLRGLPFVRPGDMGGRAKDMGDASRLASNSHVKIALPSLRANGSARSAAR